MHKSRKEVKDKGTVISMGAIRKEVREVICICLGTVTTILGGLVLYYSILLGCAMMLGGIIVGGYAFKDTVKQFVKESKESKKESEKKKQKPVPISLQPRSSAPPLEEKFIKFWKKVEWLRIIPRLRRANIPILAKVLEVDIQIFKNILPSLMKESGFQVDGDYVRLPESLREFTNALRMAFTQWNANSESHGEQTASNKKIGAWISVLEQVLLSAGGEINLQRNWISDLIDVNETEMETILLKMQGENWFHINNDLVVLHPSEVSLDILKLEDAISRNELSAEQINFIDEIDKNLAGTNSHLEKTKKNKVEH